MLNIVNPTIYMAKKLGWHCSQRSKDLKKSSAPGRTYRATTLGDADADAACIVVAGGKTIGWLIIGKYRENIWKIYGHIRIIQNILGMIIGNCWGLMIHNDTLA